jgi:hypothetical protein
MATTLTAQGEQVSRELEVSATDRLAKRKRLEYLDALKVALIVLVIAHHAGQSFGPTGGAWPLYNDERAVSDRLRRGRTPPLRHGPQDDARLKQRAECSLPTKDLAVREMTCWACSPDAPHAALSRVTAPLLLRLLLHPIEPRVVVRVLLEMGQRNPGGGDRDRPCSSSTFMPARASSSANGSRPAIVPSPMLMLTRCAGAAPRRWVPVWRARALPGCLTCGT